MTKIEMVDKIGENVALPKKDIEKVLDQFVAITQTQIILGMSLKISKEVQLCLHSQQHQLNVVEHLKKLCTWQKIIIKKQVFEIKQL